MQNNYFEVRRVSSLNSANLKTLKNLTVNKFEENEETLE